MIMILIGMKNVQYSRVYVTVSFDCARWSLFHELYPFHFVYKEVCPKLKQMSFFKRKYVFLYFDTVLGTLFQSPNY
jgi:hypothetical protein